MLNKLKTALSFAPTVEFVDYEDGLLAVKSKKALTIKNTSVKLKTSYGTILALVLVESYDATNEVYRLKLLEHDTVLDQLDIDRREHPHSRWTDDSSHIGAGGVYADADRANGRLGRAMGARGRGASRNDVF